MVNNHLDEDQEGNSILIIMDIGPSCLLLELGLDQIHALPKHKGIKRLDISIKEGLALDECIEPLVEQLLIQFFHFGELSWIYGSSWSRWLWYGIFHFHSYGCSHISTILEHGSNVFR